MTQRFIFSALAGVALGTLAFLIGLSRTFDLSEHNAALESLRQLKTVDSRLNEETLRARLAIDPDSTALIDMLPKVSAAVGGLSEGAHALLGRTDDTVDTSLAAYKQAMDEKLVLVEEFETQNLLLVESIDTIRRISAELLAGLPAKMRDERLRVLTLTKEVLEYGLLPAPENEQVVAELGVDTARMAPFLPEEIQFQAVQLSTRTNAVLTQRQTSADLLNRILQAPTVETLGKLEADYDVFHGQRLERAEFFRRLLLGYAVALLLVLAYLGWRLRNSYLDLNKANYKLARTNETLEQRVQERTRDLSKAYEALKASQSQMVQSEKMATLGQMVAGVSHEINTPLGYVRSNLELVRGMFEDLGRLVGQYARTLGLMREHTVDETQIAKAFEELTLAEAELDPTAMIEESGQLLQDGTHGLDQIGELVNNLKNFSRLDRTRLDSFDINKGLDSTLNICKHMFKDGIQIVRNYGTVPQIQCAPSQINQVFLNVVTNAVQAMNGKGQLKLNTRSSGGQVAISFEDNGCGMSADVLARVYEPFFTTKAAGKGTGLGMSIAQQIVQEHSGRIQANSQPGKGSQFVITLPVKQQAAAAAQTQAPPPPRAATA
ncbi:MAG: DAHL domain-containing protein [Nevskiales bacterium]